MGSGRFFNEKFLQKCYAPARILFLFFSFSFWTHGSFVGSGGVHGSCMGGLIEGGMVKR